MKSFRNLLVFCLAIIIGSALADTTYRGNAVHPDYPNQCYYEELQVAIPVDETVSPQNIKGECKRLYCRSDFVLRLEFCSRHNLLPNDTCSIQSDYSRPFPACCPQLVCQNENNFV